MSDPTKRRVRIGDLGKVVTGSTPPSQKPELYGDAYPFITPSDIGDQRSAHTERFISEAGRQSLRKKMLPPRSVCYTCIASIGKVCMTTELSLTNQQINSIIVDEAEHDPAYVYYLLIHETERIQGMASGAATPIINKTAFSEIEVEVHGLPTQRRIAGILSAYDDLIENNTRRIRLLEEMARALYREWFVHYRFPGHEAVQLVEHAELGAVPEGWEVTRIGDVFDVVLGGTPSRRNESYWTHGTVPWINSGRVNDLRVIDESELITEEALAKSAAKMMPARTTLIAITGATLGQVSLTEIPLCANQSVVGVIDSKGGLSEFIYLFFVEVIEAVIQHASGGAQQHINKGVVSDTPVVLPSSEVGELFKRHAKPIFDLVANLMFSNKNLRQTRDLLLPRLVSGEIPVEVAEEELEAAA